MYLFSSSLFDFFFFLSHKHIVHRDRSEFWLNLKKPGRTLNVWGALSIKTQLSDHLFSLHFTLESGCCLQNFCSVFIICWSLWLYKTGWVCSHVSVPRQDCHVKMGTTIQHGCGMIFCGSVRRRRLRGQGCWNLCYIL